MSIELDKRQCLLNNQIEHTSRTFVGVTQWYFYWSDYNKNHEMFLQCHREYCILLAVTV